MISEFHKALGQYLNYKAALRIEEPDRKLYLAIPSDIYNNFFSLELIRIVAGEYKIRLVVYNVKEEAIIKWKE